MYICILHLALKCLQEKKPTSKPFLLDFTKHFNVKIILKRLRKLCHRPGQSVLS